MTCEELIRYLSDYIDNNLDTELMDAAREHLSTCRNCHIVLDSTQKTIHLYRQQREEFRIPEARQKLLFDEIRQAFASRRDK